MYHPYKKDSSYVREALYKVYGCKCSYCNTSLELRHMHVDHILPTNRAEIVDEEVKPIVIRMFELAKSGKSPRQIANIFSQDTGIIHVKDF